MDKIKAVLVKTGNRLNIMEKDIYENYVSLTDDTSDKPIELLFESKKQLNRYAFIFEQLKTLTIVEKEIISSALQIYYHLFATSEE